MPRRGRFMSWRTSRSPYQQSFRAQHSQHQQFQYQQQQQQQIQSNEPFDFVDLPEAFPSMDALVEDQTLIPLIMERNQQLTPTPADSFALMNFATRVRQKLEALVLVPSSFGACHLSEVRDVGSHKHNTLISQPIGSQVLLTSDFVVVLKTLPTQEAITQLGTRLAQDIQSVSTPEEGALLSVRVTNFGLTLDMGKMSVHLLITTIPSNWPSLDPTIHLDRVMCKRNFNAIKHAKWIDEVCVHPSNKVLVRLLKDLRQRFPGLESLNPWLLNLLAHRCVTKSNTHESLPLSFAFKRALQLLSSGLFLPGSSGLQDPFNDGMGSYRLNTTMSFEEQDRLCSTSQTLLRALSIHPKYVLGIETGPDIFNQSVHLNGILFKPSEPVTLPNESNIYETNENASGETTQQQQQQPMMVEVNG